jgi:hypothetical protein
MGPIIDLDALGVREAKRASSGGHWVRFEKEDWDLIEKAAGRSIEPKEIRQVVLAVFSGKVKITKAS